MRSKQYVKARQDTKFLALWIKYNKRYSCTTIILLYIPDAGLFKTAWDFLQSFVRIKLGILKNNFQYGKQQSGDIF